MSAHMISSNLKLLGAQTEQFPKVSKLIKNPDVYVPDRDVSRLEGRFYQDRVQPVNIPAGVFTAASFGAFIDFQIVGIQSDVITQMDLEWNVSNSSGTTACVPLPATQWITAYTLYQGNSILENNVYSEVLTLETVLESDNTRLDQLQTLSLFDPDTGFADADGIAASATQNVYTRFPNTVLTNSMVYLPAVSQQAPVTLRIFLNGGNQLFTTAQQTMVLNSISLLVSGLKYNPSVRDEISALHKRGSVVGKCTTWQINQYPIASLPANTTINQLLQGFTGECSSLFFFLRPSTTNGSTYYGTNVLQNNIQIAAISQIMTETGENALTQQLTEAIPRLLYPLDTYPGSFKDYICYVIPFSMTPHLASSKSADNGFLKLNGNNLLQLTLGAAPSQSGPFTFFVAARMNSFVTVNKEGQISVNLL